MRVLLILLLIITLTLPLQATDGKPATEPGKKTDPSTSQTQPGDDPQPPDGQPDDDRWPFHGLQPGQEIPRQRVILLKLTDDLSVPLLGVLKGRFLQGDNSGNPDEKPAHDVEIKESFLYWQHEVTRREWRALSGEEAPGEGEDDQPVTGITWQQARDVAKKWDKPAFSLRLPTESEWEYACRAETSSKYFTGDRMRRDAAVWAQGIQETSGPQPAGKRQGNNWRLQDTAGNVYEWTADVYDPKAYTQAVTGSGGGETDGDRHVVRGGSFRTNMSALRSAARQARKDDDPLNDVGVRFVVIPKMPATDEIPVEPTDGEERIPETRDGLIQGLQEKFAVAVSGNFTTEALKMSYETLQKLPAAFRGRTNQIHFAGNRGSIGGWVTMPQQKVNLTPSGTSPYVLVHEMAHTWQGGNTGVLNEWSAKFWGSSPRSIRSGGRPKGKASVTGYGNTNPWEDMAESVAHFVSDGKRMKKSHPDRYEFVKNKIFEGKEYI